MCTRKFKLHSYVHTNSQNALFVNCRFKIYLKHFCTSRASRVPQIGQFVVACLSCVLIGLLSFNFTYVTVFIGHSFTSLFILEFFNVTNISMHSLTSPQIRPHPHSPSSHHLSFSFKLIHHQYQMYHTPIE